MGYRSFFAAAAISGVVLVAVAGCGSSGKSVGSNGGEPNTGGSGAGSSGAGSSGAGAPPVGPTGPYDSGMTPVSQLDMAPSTKLPSVPAMTNVVALQGQDGAAITFDPVDGAADYRVYELPADGDITVAASQAVVVKNGTYRCAGTHEAPAVYKDAEPMLGGQAIHTQVDMQMVGGYTRTLADATLGYVYTEAGAGRKPVYALGDSNPNADTTCFFGRYGASRMKLYTQAEDERKSALKAFARDDGIAFYVPAAADDTTTTINVDTKGIGTAFQQRYYFPDGPEADAHMNKAAAFPVLKKAAPGTQALMRVYYANECGWSHDELALGLERFHRNYFQGDKGPSFTLTWSGYKAPTTLVVEALDAQCPFQGHLSAHSEPTLTVHFGNGNIVHQPWLTLDDARTASSTKEVFVNGQGAAANQPKAVARAFIKVSPQTHYKMDFFEDFAPGSADETFTTVPCGIANCFATWRQQSATFDQIFINAESGSTTGSGLFTFGRVLGEYWVSYADASGDTNGKFRMTANQKATLSSSDYLHVTMEADAYSTARRYPQIIISDADIPVQYGLETGHSLLIQPRAQINETIDFPVNYELQVCNLRTWDVNNQCPVYDLTHVNGSDGKVDHLAPNDEFGEHASVDHRVLFDVFASTDRAYLFLDGQPYGCAILPPGVMRAGPTTVTWGDALYHSAVDHTFAFHTQHMLVEQRRHFDNLGFSSGVKAPTWDESRFPCAAPITL